MGKTIAYLRVFDREDGAADEASLRSVGADRVFVDSAELAGVHDRSQWQACLDALVEGDTLVVRRLSHLGTSERSVIRLMNDLAGRRIDIKSLTEPTIDTTTSAGKALFDIVAVLGQLRSDSLRESTVRGLRIARSQGRIGGRPSVMSADRIADARAMRAQGRSIAQIASELGVGASSVSRALIKHRQDDSALKDDGRVFFRDIKPYEVPTSLEQLRGPARGFLTLPHSVY